MEWKSVAANTLVVVLLFLRQWLKERGDKKTTKEKDKNIGLMLEIAKQARVEASEAKRLSRGRADSLPLVPRDETAENDRLKTRLSTAIELYKPVLRRELFDDMTAHVEQRLRMAAERIERASAETLRQSQTSMPAIQQNTEAWGRAMLQKIEETRAQVASDLKGIEARLLDKSSKELDAAESRIMEKIKLDRLERELNRIDAGGRRRE